MRGERSSKSLEVEGLKQVVVEALQRAYANHQQLGGKGKEYVRTNAFGERTLEADWQAEEMVLTTLTERGVPVRVVSEEHGIVDIAEDPKYLGILDGIDGTTAYRLNTGRYGTMFAIFDSTNPKYQDYVVSGVVDQLNETIYFAVKNDGTHMLDLKTNQITTVTTSRKTDLDPQETRVDIDGWFEVNNEVFADNLKDFEHVFVGTPENGGASSRYYIDLTRGEVDFVGECTRKRNLEIAVAYGLVTEAGGVIVDLNGESLEPKKYWEFGQGEEEQLPVITAATPELAREVVEFLRLISRKSISN